MLLGRLEDAGDRQGRWRRQGHWCQFQLSAMRVLFALVTDLLAFAFIAALRLAGVLG